MNTLRTNESGRSMIEMLGVLAIIGVLSVGGIAGYSKAMTKFKTNQVADNVSMLVANIKTLYAQQKSYNGLNTENAITLGVVPDELKKSATQLTNAFNGSVVINASNSTKNETLPRAFYIIFNGLPKEACISLATNDWGSGYSSGLIALHAQATEYTKGDWNAYIGCTSGAGDGIPAPANGSSTDASDYINGGISLASADNVQTNAGISLQGDTPAYSASGYTSCPGSNMPMPVGEAASACSCNNGNTCSVMWKYY